MPIDFTTMDANTVRLCPSCHRKCQTNGNVCLLCNAELIPTGFRMVDKNGTAHIPRLNSYDSPHCPICGHDDIAMWANDGEADLADWWDCQTSMGGCGEHGAVTSDTDTTVTQNGVPVSDYELEV